MSAPVSFSALQSMIILGESNIFSRGTLVCRKFDVREFTRFAIVGLMQNGLNISVFALAIAFGVPLLVASVLAASVALTASFFANRQWTFRHRTDRTRARAIRFVAIWVTIVLLGLPFLAILVEVVHLPRILAQSLVIVSGAPISYLAQRRWTFAD